MSPNCKEFSTNLPQNLMKLVKMHNSPQISSVLSLLCKTTGDLNAGLMLDNLVYWWGRARKPDGWVWKSASDWWGERHLTQSQVSRVHRAGFLESAGVERTQKLTLKGNPVHYRLHVKTFIERVAQVIGWTVEAVAAVLYPEKNFAADEQEPSVATDNPAIADSTNYATPEQKDAFAESAKETSLTIQSLHNYHNQDIQTTTETDVVVETDSVFSLKENDSDAAVDVPDTDSAAIQQERAEAAEILKRHKPQFLQAFEALRAEKQKHADEKREKLPSTAQKNWDVPPKSGEIVIDFEVVPGLKPHTVKKLVQQYGRERVVDVMRYAFGQDARNPAGMVVKALREEWQVTFSSHVDKPKSPFAGMKWADFAG